MRSLSGLILLSSEGVAQGTCPSEEPDCSTEDFLAPLLQFMPLTGQAGILGAPIPQLKPSATDMDTNPKGFHPSYHHSLQQKGGFSEFPLFHVSFVIRRFQCIRHPCVTLEGLELGTRVWSPCLIN